MANCSSPTSPVGSYQYFTGDNKWKFCDGSNWKDFVCLQGCTGLGSCSTAGRLDYDSVGGFYKYCDGSNWTKIDGGTGSDGNIAFRASATSISSTVTAPASIQAGDILVLLDLAVSGSTPTSVVPPGFAVLQDINGSQYRQTLSYKLADGSEAGAIFTGMNGTSEDNKILFAFSAGASALIPSPFNGDATNANPPAQTILASGAPAPLVVLGAYSSSDPVSPRTMSPAKDGEQNTPDNGVWLAYKIYNSSPADVTVDIADEGNANTIQSGYIQATIPAPSGPGASCDSVNAGAIEHDSVNNKLLFCDGSIWHLMAE